MAFDESKFDPETEFDSNLREHWLHRESGELYLNLRVLTENGPAKHYGPKFHEILNSLTPEDGVPS